MKNNIVALALIIILLIPLASVNSTSYANKFVNSYENIIYAADTSLFIENITAPPSVFDLFNNNTNYILLVANDTLYCTKFNGINLQNVWAFRAFNSTLLVSPLATDFDGDGINEIALLDNRGIIYFLEPDNGNIIRKIETGIVPLDLYGNMAVFDEDGDGLLDVLFFTSSNIIIASFNGSVHTRDISPINIAAMYGIPIVDLNNTVIPHILYASGSNLVSYSDLASIKTVSIGSQIVLIGSIGNFTSDNENVTVYEIPVITINNTLSFVAFTKIGLEKQAIRYSISIDKLNQSSVPPISLDFDRDGYDEVFVLLLNGTGYVISSSGIERVISLESNATCIPIIADIDSDSNPDIILTLENGTITAIDSDSTTVLISSLSNPRWPIIGDLDGDGLSELLVVTNDGLEIHDLGTSSSINWLVYLHDTRRTDYYHTPKDSDGDGISDQIESTHGTIKTDSDSDDDGLNDFAEMFLINTDPLDNDTDDDGLPDGWEYRYGLNATNNDTNDDGVSDADEDLDSDNITNINEFGNGTNPLSVDTDDDQLSDYEEIAKYGTNPRSYDTDGDGMPDGWEIQYNLNPLNATDSLLDNDHDNVINVFEYGNGTSPLDPDTDGDGMPDGWEIQYNLNPTSSSDRDLDNDNDNLTNILEFKLGTNPLKNDTDGDGMPDGWEYRYGLDPINGSDNITDIDGDKLTNLDEFGYGTNPRSYDTDGDGMPDGWEIQYNLNPLRKDDYLDPDGDGLNNAQEYAYRTNPLNPDTDGDGIPDGTEVLVYRTNPLSNDTDMDELSDLAEITIGTNPNDGDTDGDGISDYEEIMRGTNPLDPFNGVADAVFLGIISILSILLLVSIILPIIRKKDESIEKKK